MSKATRSNSNPDFSIDAVKVLIDSLKREILKELKNESNLLGSRLDSINEKSEKFEEQLFQLQSNVKKNNEQISFMKESIKRIEDGRSQQLEEIHEEVEQRILRKTNVIIRGLPQLTFGDQMQRSGYDRKRSAALFDTLGVEENAILHVRRLGKVRKNMKRILKVYCRDEETVKKLLMKAKSLRSSDNFKSVYIGKDLTIRQQKDEKFLREELERRRRDGENVVLYRGKICNKSEIDKDSRRQHFR